MADEQPRGARARTRGSSTRCTSSTWPTRLGERELAGVLRRLPPRRRRRRRHRRRRRRHRRRRRRRPHRPPAPAPRRAAAGRRPAAPAAPPAPPSRRASRSAAPPPASSRTWRPASTVPTATSFREVPAKLLEVNRTVINGYLGRTRAGKVSFTHLIGFAVVRAIADAVPAMNIDVRRGADGKPRVVRHEHVEPRPRRRRREVRRQPHAARAGHQGRRHARLRAASWRAYEDLIRKVAHQQARRPTTSPGATVTLTNPGTIGTVQSVPRLMPGQGVIVGVGAHRLPGRVRGRRPADARRARRVSKVVTLTSHLRPPHHPGRRVRRCSSSGSTSCCSASDDFYDDIFRVARRALRGGAVAPRRQPGRPRAGDAREADAGRTRSSTCTACAATSSPTSTRWRWKEPHMHAELDPATYGLTIWDLDREFLTGGLAGARAHDARRHPRRAARRVLPHDRRRVHAHPGARREALDPGAGRGRARATLATRRAAPHPRAAERRRGVREVPATKYLGPEALRPRRRRVGHPDPRRDPRRRPPTPASTACVIGMAHRGRLNVLANIVGKCYDADLQRVRGRPRPDVDAGLGRREVPPRRDRQVRQPRAATTSRVELAANPSHLEAVDPVVEGMARAKQDRIDRPESLPGAAGADPRRRRVRRPGRGGRDAEPVATSRATASAAPSTSSSTTSSASPPRPSSARSSRVRHRRRQDGAGADLPRERRRPRGLRAGRPARVRVPPDVPQGRRHRHGLLPPLRPQRGRRPELHPAADVQARSTQRRAVRKLYTEALVKRGDITLEEAEQALDDFQRRLQAALDETRAARRPSGEAPPSRRRPHRRAAPRRDRRRPRRRSTRSSTRSPTVPEGFTVHPKLAKQFETARQDVRRAARSTGRSARRWRSARCCSRARRAPRRAGHPARHVQPAPRRARRLRDRAREYAPLDHLDRATRRQFWIYDSLLSEYAALGFEYGYSVRQPGRARRAGRRSSATSSTARRSSSTSSSSPPRTSGARRRGLVLLLPHGYEGQGPEHSSARIERFLTLCAEDNIQVVQRHDRGAVLPPAAPPGARATCASRSSCSRPKSLLRMKQTRSPIDELTDRLVPGGARRPGVTDPRRGRSASCSASGKVGVRRHRRARRARRAGRRSSASSSSTRGPYEQLAERARSATRTPSELVWLQEEPENMGPWAFVDERLWPLVPRGHRATATSPASGPAARPPARKASTTRSSRRSSTRPSTASRDRRAGRPDN